MERLATTPFGQRTLAAALAQQVLSKHEMPADLEAEKWPLFRELCTARTAFNLSDRDLTVLNALLTFHQPATLSGDIPMVVYPSNKTLSARANGMAESTLRRHLATLTCAGIISRQDSPNGKRYARKTHHGTVVLAFGFDLSPMLERCTEIREAAEQIREKEALYRLQKDEVSLLKRDALKLTAYGSEVRPDLDWSSIQATLSDLHKQNRRKLSAEILLQMKEDLALILLKIRDLIACETTETSGNDLQNERHCQRSNTEVIPKPKQVTYTTTSPQIIPIEWIRKAAPDILDYSPNRLASWDDLYRTAAILTQMIGVTKSAWEEATSIMGPIQASIVIACMTQRVTEIRNPTGYLRNLTSQVEKQRFSPVSMVMALLNKNDSP